MHLDSTVTITNILVLLSMIVGIIGAFIKFRDEMNKKADKEVVNKIENDLKLLLTEIKSNNDKIEELKQTNNEKLDEIKMDIKELEKKYDIMYKDFLILKTEHGRNHK